MGTDSGRRDWRRGVARTSSVPPAVHRGLDLARQFLAGQRPGLPREVVSRLDQRLGGRNETLPMLVDDLLKAVDAPPADSGSPRPGSRGVHGVVAWVCTPPAPGSGGHTTFFRMVQSVRERGHDCVLYLYDPHGGSLERHAEVVRRGWPELSVPIRDADEGLEDARACVASSWQTAYVVAARSARHASRIYFIQDFEPYFYPRGSLYSLAEGSYRLGFRHIALGQMVAELLGSEVGVDADVVSFGCDSSVYHLESPGGADRAGIAFFARQDTPRRGYLLGSLALELFHRRHPDVDIHVYGADAGRFRFPVVDHGRLTPAELNRLYNRTIAGLSLSFTNVTLVAEEMLAAGTIPVANESPLARAGLDNPHVSWTLPTPEALAGALEDLVIHSTPAGVRSRAEAAALSVRKGWGSTGEAVADIIEQELVLASAARGKRP